MNDRTHIASLPGIGASLFADHGHGFRPGRGPSVVFDASGNPSPEMELKTLAVNLKSATDEVKRYAEKTNTEIKNLGDVTRETKENADKALREMNDISTRLTDIEQKMSRRGGAGAPELKSLGQSVVDNDEMKAALARGTAYKGRVDVEVKAITSVSTSGTSGTSGLVVADRQPQIVQVVPNRRMTIRNLLAPGSTSSSAIDYVRETGFTNSAAVVAENPGSPKPQSDITFDLKSLPVRTIAHWVLASKQILADAPMLRSYIDGRLLYGLQYAEELELLLGDGSGVHILGLMPQATAFAAPSGITIQNATMIDKLRLAMLQSTIAQYPATGHILNPTDWAGIETTKDSQNRYIIGNPQGTVQPTLWGLPVIDSLAMPQNNFLTGAFAYAAQIFDREDATVSVSTEDRDNFVKNMVTVLAEERLALAVYRPQALIKGTFVTA